MAAGAVEGIASGMQGRGASLGSMAVGAGIGLASSALRGMGNVASTEILNETNLANTAWQGNLTNERATQSALAKYNDAQNVADNVSLQGGNVFFTFQNQFQGYCLVYKQISDEYIKVITAYFRKYGYAYNQIETPILRTRQNWDYIRTIDCNITGNVNDKSLEVIKGIFNNGVTIWHTSDVGNYSLNNNEI